MNTYISNPSFRGFSKLLTLSTLLSLVTMNITFAQQCGPIRGEKSGRIIETGKCNSDGQRYGEWTFYYDNNLKDEIRLKAKGNYALGKKHGTWTYYDEYGPYVLKEATYHFGILSGPYKDYYDTGHKNRWIKSKGEYKSGKREGQWIDYWDNGCYGLEGPPKEIAIYKAGIKHGESATFYDSNCFPEKAMASRGYYDNGKKDGEWKYYNDKGNEDANLIRKFNFDKGRMVGKHYLYENGRMTKSFDYTSEPGDEGIPEFDDAGKLIKKVYPDFYLTFYEAEGDTPPLKRKVETDANGKKIGTWLTYYESGAIKHEDTPEGRTSYYENGRLWYTIGHSKDDRTAWEGTQKVYRENGTIKLMRVYAVNTVNYNNGPDPGEDLKWYAVFFYPNGGIELVEQYNRFGSIISQYQLHEDGSFKLIGGPGKKGYGYKEKKYKKGKKFPSTPPEWVVRASDHFSGSQYRKEIQAFFKSVNEVTNGN